MIDSELCRLLLEHYRVPYREEPHGFILGSVLALAQVGSPQVPALHGNGLRLVGPEAMIDRWDECQPPGRSLIPPDPAMAAIARRDWVTLHGPLADAVARLAYHYLLPLRTEMIEAFTRGVPAREAPLARWLYPLQRVVLSGGLKLAKASPEACLTQIRATFALVEARAGDGRRFLQGDRVTLGDVALAAALGPLTLPRGNRSPLPPLSAMPSALQAIIAELQARQTAGLVQRFYDTALAAA